MPGKLKVLAGMYGINVLLGVVGMIIAEGGISGLILPLIAIGLLFVKNNIVRIVIIVLSVIGLIFSALGLLTLGVLLAVGFGGAVIVGILSIIWGIIVGIYAIYALTRPEVKDYFGGGAAAAPPQG